MSIQLAQGVVIGAVLMTAIVAGMLALIFSNVAICRMIVGLMSKIHGWQIYTITSTHEGQKQYLRLDP